MGLGRGAGQGTTPRKAHHAVLNFSHGKTPRINETNKDQRYIKTLESFLKASGEDRVDIDGILKQVSSYAPQTQEALEQKHRGQVLDVGSGNGAKAIYLAQQLELKGTHITIDSIEPKSEQRAQLLSIYSGDTKKYAGDIIPESLESAELSKEYDLILVIHSLYEFPRSKDGNIISLERLSQLLNKTGSAVIIIEDPQGDLQRMKQELYPRFGKREPVSQELVERTLKEAGASYRVGNRIEFRFELDHIINEEPADIGTALEFLFSDSLEEEPLTHEQRTQVGEWAKQHYRSENSKTYLWTPDIPVWVRK